MFVSSCLVVIIIIIVKRDSWMAVSKISMFAEKQKDFSC